MEAYALDAWTVLGDGSRRQIVERLAERSRSVVELAKELPISRPAVSQHLKLLKRAGLVRSRPHGTRRIYELDHERLRRYQQELDGFWAATLTNLGEALAEDSSPGRRRDDDLS